MEKLTNFLTEMFDYYNRPVSGGAFRVYLKALKTIPLNDLQTMFDKHITDPDQGQYMPKISDFVRVSQGTKKGNSVAAWHKIHTAIEQIGPYKSFSIDDPWAMKALEEMGGFLRLCELTSKELDFKVHDFHKAYESLRAQGVPDSFPSKVKGLVELENGQSDDVLLVGDKSRAQRVMEQGEQKPRSQITQYKTPFLRDHIEEFKKIALENKEN